MPKRVNVITNPAFEVDATGWSAYTGVAAPTAVTTNPFSGTKCLQAVGNSTSTAPRVSFTYTAAFTTGDSWTLQARLRKDGTWPTGFVTDCALRWQLSAGGESVSLSGVAFVPDANGYMLISVTGTVPSGCNGTVILNLGFQSLASNLTSAGSLSVDNVQLEKSAVLGSYFDGSVAPAYWQGAANASASTMPVIDVALDTVSMRSKLTLDGFKEADGPVTITRVHPDGSSFAVRDTPNLSAGSAFTVDYELPFSEAIYYTCPDTNGLVSSPLTTLTSVQFWLRVPGQPDYDNPVEVEAKPVIVRAKPQTVLRPLGRANPVVLSGARDGGSFDLHVRTVTASDVARLLGSLNAGSTLLLVMPGSRLSWVYVVVGDITETPVAPWQSQVDGDAGSQSTWVLPCIVVDRAAGGMLADSAFSYATLLADWSTYSAMLAANTSYLKLMSGL